jgi:hypothetical protein
LPCNSSLADTTSGRVHEYKVVIPRMTGTNSAASNGSVRDAASNTRRATSAQLPPVMCVSINSARHPSGTPTQNKKPVR